MRGQAGSGFKHAIKALWKIGRIGINQIERRGGRRAGADGDPIHQIGGGKQDVILIWRPGQLQLESTVAECARHGEVDGRQNCEQAAGSDAVIVARFNGVGADRDVGAGAGIGQNNRIGINEGTDRR